MFDVAKTLWEIASGLFGLRDKFLRAKRDERDRAATYFSDIAELIEKVAVALDVRQYPSGSCAQLETLAQLMPQSLSGLLDASETVTYQKKLMAVHEIERLLAELNQDITSDAERKLKQLRDAVGFFRGLADHLRVAKP